MLIAVASKDGKEINQHFGHAERFLIYDVGESATRLVDEKKVDRYCSFDPEHPLRGDLLRKIVEALAGCRALLCAQIGQCPQMEMERLGIDTYVVEGPIRTALLDLAKVL
ncbi:MAG TPA: NifB/NifX family molybdenum-iron cluster-binding protein [Geobacteraceae bacterium]|nr:NifB/NifX family molybdenum-iron cluster-binding protein [Geobacteraceae bacterium]